MVSSEVSLSGQKSFGSRSGARSTSVARSGHLVRIDPTTSKPLGTEMRAPESPGSVRRWPLDRHRNEVRYHAAGASVATGDAPHPPLMISSNLTGISTSRQSRDISSAYGLQMTWA